MTLTTVLLAIAIGLGAGAVIGLCLHIWLSDDRLIEEDTITELKKEIVRLQTKNCDLRDAAQRLKSLNNDVASQNVYYREKNNKLEEENTALKLKLNEMEEARRDTLDHNAYLSKEAMRLNETNLELKKRQAETSNYLKAGLESRISLLRGSHPLYEQGAYAAYVRVLDEIVSLEKKYESEDKK